MRDPDRDLIQTRSTLIGRLKNLEDHVGWQDFFDTYWKLIYGFAIKSGMNKTEALDVVQETMIAVAKHTPNFNYNRDKGTFRAWLLGMTRWRIADQFRLRPAITNWRLPADCPDPADAVPLEKIADQTSLHADAIWETEWKVALSEIAIANVKRTIDPAHYQIFHLSTFKEQPPTVIAEIYGIKVAQVYLTKHRVTEAIKKEIERLKQQVT
jgi:RNA polymerase sigma-70 factor (ECF subfamily)